MNLDSVPIWIVTAVSVLFVMVSIEAGYRLGRIVCRSSVDEKEAPSSTISSAALGTAAFMLAFAFGIVADRYEARKALVRADANAIRTAYARADFLAAEQRAEARRLLGAYLDTRLSLFEVENIDQKRASPWFREADQIQRRLWDMAVANAGKDMNSDVAALYLESLNDMAEVHASRVALGVQSRIPIGLWIALYSLVFLGMLSLGYHTGVVGSARSGATLLISISFAMVIAMIAALDRPWGFVRIAQQPLIDLRDSIAEGN